MKLIKLESNNPDSCSIHYLKGLIRIKQKNYKQALQNLNSAIEKSPTEHNPYSAEGQVFYETGDYVQAINILKTAIDINKDEDQQYYYLSCCFCKLKNKKKAVEYYNDFLNTIDNNIDFDLTSKENTDLKRKIDHVVDK